METIVAKNITKRYDTGRGIENLSLSVHQGQCFGVLGANGSGKTTLTRLIAGLDRIKQGYLSVLGDSIFPRPSRLRRRCGVALDIPTHWKTLTGRQNLLFFTRQYGLVDTALTQRIEELLYEANLTSQADDPVSTYSFGMRRKLSIIEAFAHDPELLILDEPSAGIDMAFLDRLAHWIGRRCEVGLTTWIADNDADWLAKVATDAVLLSNGHIAAGGSVKELMDSIDARYRITIKLEEPDFSYAPTLAGVTRFQCDQTRITADLSSDPHLPSELLGWITTCGGQVRAMEVCSVTLHEALQQRAGHGEVAV